MDLQELRKQIDEIDDQLVSLFVQRMNIAAAIGSYKKEHGLPVFVPAREAEKLSDVAQKSGPDMAQYTRALYTTLFALSRNYQEKLTENATLPEGQDGV